MLRSVLRETFDYIISALACSRIKSEKCAVKEDSESGFSMVRDARAGGRNLLLYHPGNKKATRRSDDVEGSKGRGRVKREAARET